MSSSQSLFPVQNSVETDPSPELIRMDAADELFEALASATARSVIASIYEEPATASELAEGVDTSLQNVQYHLDQLCDAGLVEVVDTWYSEKGTEMKVYGPAADPLMICASALSRKQ